MPDGFWYGLLCGIILSQLNAGLARWVFTRNKQDKDHPDA